MSQLRQLSCLQAAVFMHVLAEQHCHSVAPLSKCSAVTMGTAKLHCKLLSHACRWRRLARVFPGDDFYSEAEQLLNVDQDVCKSSQSCWRNAPADSARVKCNREVHVPLEAVKLHATRSIKVWMPGAGRPDAKSQRRLSAKTW